MDTAVGIGTERTRGAGRRMRSAVVLALAVGMSAVVPSAGAVDPGPAVLLPSEAVVVAGGPGNQNDPHVSGSLVVYSERAGSAARIHYADLADGSSGVIPNPDGHLDSLPDVAGSLVVFRRVDADVYNTARPIMVFDVEAPGLGVREVAPEPGARRTFPSVGGTTVAFMQMAGGTSSATEVCVADVASGSPATCLTSDGTMNNVDPAVSPDGSTVAWAKCAASNTGCDIYVARRGPDGSWGPPVQLTDSTGEEWEADTDGSIVTYASNAGNGPLDYDVWWENVDGTNERRLDLSDAPRSNDVRPRISGGAISFQRELEGSTDGDLFLYRLETGVLHRLTDTPADESLNGVSLSPDGELRVVWAQPDGAFASHDIHALTAQLGSAAGPTYAACLLYDPAKAHRSGSTAPLKVQLCGADGANLSSPDVVPTAAGLVKLDGSATTALADGPGNSNPDSAFRYDPDLAGYVFNLSTKGLSRGTWELRFTVAGSPTVHALPFDVR